jgi:tripartite-type tricarboxylate transporter receptor subunit TctC
LAAGGPSDQAARVLARVLKPLLGQEVLVENKAGANGAIGAQALAAAAADGQTLLFAPSGMTGLPVLMKNPPFKSLADFTPLGAVGGNQICLFVHASLPVTTTKEFVAYAKAHPDQLNYGSNSSGEYLAAAQVIQTTGLRMTRVPYRGSAQMMPDLLENRVQLAFIPPGLGLPQVQAGRLKVLGCNAPQRLPALPELPTLVESGVSQGGVPPLHFLLAPARLPAPQAARLSQALLKAAADPALRAEYEKIHIVPEALGAEQSLVAIRDGERVWAQFVRDASITPE